MLDAVATFARRVFGLTPARPRSASTSSTPAAPPPPPQPPPDASQSAPKQSTLVSEFVAGAAGYGSAAGTPLELYYRSLPPWIDDITRDFGWDIYQRMQRDEAVASGLRTVVNGVMADGLTFRPAVDDKKDQYYSDSKKELQRCEREIDDLPRSADEILRDLLQAAAVGNRVAEIVFRKDSGGLVLDRLKMKSQRATAFVVDGYMNVAGLVALTPGSVLPVTGVVGLADLKDAKVLPRQKFAVLTWMPVDEDPRGSSLLACVYQAWWQKMQTGIDYIKYLSQFASPSLVGILGKDIYDDALTDGLGNPTGAAAVTAVQKLLNALLQFRNGTALALPFGSQVSTLFAATEGQAFIAAMERYDARIAKGITGQLLATEDPKHNTRAAAGVHQDTMGAGLKYPKLLAARTISRDVLRLMTRVNLGDAAARTVAPFCTLAASEQQDKPALLAAYAQAYAAKFIKDSQLPALFEELGLPPIPPEELQAMADAKKAAMVAASAGGTKAAPGAKGGAVTGGKQPATPDGKTAAPAAAFAGHDVSDEERDRRGRWAEDGGDSAPTAAVKAPATRGAMAEARREGKGKDAKVVMADGSPAPAHIKPSMVPPDWTGVKVSLDPKADVLVTARDKAGRTKTVYADSFHMRNAAVKFARVKEGLDKAGAMAAQIQRDRFSPATKEQADCLWLIQEQGTRPGSEKDTGAKAKAYGATTLEGRHVVETPEGVRLRFVGKEGVSHDHLIKDAELGKMILGRAKAAGPDGQLFATDETRLQKYARTLDGGSFTPKDFRTMLATRLAVAEIARTGNPNSAKEYKAAVKRVAEKVSGVLGNRPQQALESYIAPEVFAILRVLSDAGG